MSRPASLSAVQARRIALAANGLLDERPSGRVDRRHVRKVFDRLGVVQLDSVNVCVRTQYLTLFSRLGPYDSTLLDRVAYEDHAVFEYWGHMASLVDVDLQPLLRWRMTGDHAWTGPNSVAAKHPDLVAALERAVVDHGPVSAGELDEDPSRKGPWWGWSDTKRALEYLFWTGRVSALRRGNFERVYCAPDVAVAPEILGRPTPTEEDAKRLLLLRAARAHGIGTAKDLADYWRTPVLEARRLLAGLADDGALAAVDVEGWKEPGYLHPDARIPRVARAASIVSPFDQAMWERDRVLRLFDFDYRIEIYVPAAKRRYGYYVLPFLLGDTYVARVDLKADRSGRRLLVQAAWAEADLAGRGTDDVEVAVSLAAELRSMAGWLALDDVVVVGVGDLAPALATVLGEA